MNDAKPSDRMAFLPPRTLVSVSNAGGFYEYGSWLLKSHGIFCLMKQPRAIFVECAFEPLTFSTAGAIS